MPPPIRALAFARYRGFRDSHRVELGRLNLVYGENNAGKSALVRLPALVGESRTPGTPGLALSGAARGGAFRDVRWRGTTDDSDPDLSLGLELAGGDAWRWSFRWVRRSVAVIQRAALARGASTVAIDRDDLEARDVYRKDGVELDPKFDGVVPGSGVIEDAPRQALVAALKSVIWLEAKREAPSREGFALGEPGEFTSTGEKLAPLVAREHELKKRISEWFARHVGAEVEVEQLGADRQRLVLRRSGAEFDVPFPDAGEGLQQVFAVVTALEHVRLAGGLLCIEEPESHLHPRLERAVAELMVDVLSTQRSASVLLETHSEIFLAAALTAAVERLKGEVRTFWVDVHEGASRVEEVPLDAEGRPTTPRFELAFETMGVMRRELLLRRRALRGS
ncbi:MAG: ATP-binding protein [Polyangiaceae bacterium]